jgi:ankyrin repeat protein
VYCRTEDLGDECPRDKATGLLLQGGLREADIHALLRMTSDANWVEEYHITRVHRLVTDLIAGDLEEELRNDPSSINALDAICRTPLHWAAARGNLANCVTILQYGVNPNILDEFQSKPLVYAADRNHTECARILLQAGARPNIYIPGNNNNRMDSALSCAIRNATDPKLIRMLLQFGADDNTTGVDHFTPLIHAARTNKAKFALIFLEHGASIHWTAKNGHTALTTALTHNRHLILEILLAHSRLQGHSSFQITQATQTCRCIRRYQDHHGTSYQSAF